VAIANLFYHRPVQACCRHALPSGCATQTYSNTLRFRHAAGMPSPPGLERNAILPPSGSGMLQACPPLRVWNAILFYHPPVQACCRHALPSGFGTQTYSTTLRFRHAAGMPSPLGVRLTLAPQLKHTPSGSDIHIG
jgi:hypothetical protein